MTVSENPRERLLDTAGEIFAEKGFKGATIREIIDRAGVNIAAVNYYFRDKERLYIEAVKHGACGEADEQLRWPSDTPPSVKLADFIRSHVLRLLDPGKPAWHARLMMRELTQPSSACTELVRDYIEPKSKILGGILEELLPPGTPHQERFLAAFSIMGQVLFYCTHKPIVTLLAGEEGRDYFEPARLAEHITRFSLRALGLDDLDPVRRPARASRSSRMRP